MNFFQTKGLLSKILILLTLFLATQMIKANNPCPKFHLHIMEECDACGCSNNGGSLGLGGVIENNFIGIRHLHQKHQSKDGIFDNSPTINEYFNTIQIWSRIPVIKDYLEAQIFMPIHFHQRVYSNKTTKIDGLGDISFLVNYTLLNKNYSKYRKEKNKIFSYNHILKLGTGLKLPTGTFNETINNAVNPSFQLGTGSIDFLASCQYIFKHNNFGATNYLNYFVKTKNSDQYKFGNQFNFNSTIFYAFEDVKKNKFVPSLGVSGEFYQPNEILGIPIRITKGYAIFSNIGVEYNSKKITLGLLTMYPINQELTQGTIQIKYRSSVYLNYNF